jgi:hypothetical protein
VEGYLDRGGERWYNGKLMEQERGSKEYNKEKLVTLLLDQNGLASRSLVNLRFYIMVYFFEYRHFQTK